MPAPPRPHPIRATALLTALLAVLAVLVAPAAGADPEGPVRLLSTAADGGPADHASSSPAISADGRYVTFVSQASDLVEEVKVGGAGASNVFTYDRQTGETLLVSRAAAGGATGAGSSTAAVMTPDGRYVAYTSTAPDLVAGQGPDNGRPDVFVWDRTDRSTRLVSAAVGGGECDPAGIGGSLAPSISDDGRYVAFQSDCTDLVTPAVGNAHADVYLWDRTGPAVSDLTPGRGGPSDGPSQNPRIDGDGTRVVFQSAATNLSPIADGNGQPDVYLRVIGGGITPVSTTPAGATGNGPSGDPQISRDGRYVAFETQATDLTGDTYPGASPQNVVLVDTGATPPTTTLVSRSTAADDRAGDGGSSAPRISADGSTLAYRTAATDTAPGPDANGATDVVVWHRPTGTSARASRTPGGAAGDGASTLAATTYNPQKLSADGRYLVFESTASDLVPGVSGAIADVYVFDRVAGTVALLSRAADGAGGGDGPSTQPVISADGSAAAWASDATDLRDPADGNGRRDVYGVLGVDAPVLSIADAEVLRGDDGPDAITFEVTLTPTAAAEVTVAYATADRTAAAGRDYEATSGVLSFPPGEGTRTITVPLLPAPPGPARTFEVVLSEPTGAQLQRATAVGRIADAGVEDPVLEERDGVSDTIRIHLRDDPNAPTTVSVRYSRATFGGDAAAAAPEEVLLATSGGFADALASGALQATRGPDGALVGGRPLLLTPTDTLAPAVADELARLGASRVRILGGVVAVSQAVEDDLVARGYEVVRYEGPTRLETATDIAARAFPDATTAVLARAFPAEGATDPTQAFADSLAAGAWAAAEGWPLLLTQTDVLSDSTRAHLEASQITTVHVVGGDAAIAEPVLDELRAMGLAVERVAGPSRFDTALAVAERRGHADERTAPRVILIEGQADDAWAAGFAAAAHSALHDAPLVLGTEGLLPPVTAAWLDPQAADAAGAAGAGTAGFAVDETAITGPVLVCAIAADRCDEARRLLGLPELAEVALDQAGTTVPQGTTLTGTVRNAVEGARLQPQAGCLGEVDEADLPAAEAAQPLALELPDDAREGPCDITFVIAFPNGSVQTVVQSLDVSAAG